MVMAKEWIADAFNAAMLKQKGKQRLLVWAAIHPPVSTQQPAASKKFNRRPMLVKTCTHVFNHEDKRKQYKARTGSDNALTSRATMGNKEQKETTSINEHQQAIRSK